MKAGNDGGAFVCVAHREVEPKFFEDLPPVRVQDICKTDPRYPIDV